MMLVFFVIDSFVIHTSDFVTLFFNLRSKVSEAILKKKGKNKHRSNSHMLKCILNNLIQILQSIKCFTTLLYIYIMYKFISLQ